MDTYKQPAHKVINAYGTRPVGPYTTKAKLEKGMDTFGNVTPYVPEPYKPKDAYKRDAYKGKQLKVVYAEGEFNKIVYDPSKYEDKTTKNKKGAKGFCSSKPFGRDDISSMLDTTRYRDALEKEQKFAREAAAKNAAATVDLLESVKSAGLLETSYTGTVGLARNIPKDVTDFDRQQHQEDFVTKVPHTVKYTREYGTYKVASSEIGEGCGELQILRSPTYAKKSMMTDSLVDKLHLVPASMSGYKVV